MCYKNMLTTNCVHLNCLLTQYVGIFNYILTKEYIMRWMWKGFICFFIKCTLSPFDLFFLLFFSVRLLSVLRGHSVFSSPLQRPISQILSITFIFSILILEKEPVFPFWMFSAKQGHYRYHFYNVFGMSQSLTGDWTRDLPHSKPALYQ